MEAFIMKVLRPENWPEFRESRSISLLECPLAFGKNPEEEADLHSTYWINFLSNPKKIVIGLKADGILAGHVILSTPEGKKYGHYLELQGMYVRSCFRGYGYGSKLMEEAIRITHQSGATKLALRVNKALKPSVKFYKKFGFKIVGCAYKEICYLEKFYDELSMELQFEYD